MEFIDVTRILPGLKGIVLHVANIDANALTDLLTKHGFDVYVLDGSLMLDERAFFEQAKDLFGFPDYFGYGWASWDDSMGDFAQLSPSKVAIIWKDADKTFATIPHTLLQAVSDMYGIAFRVALRGRPGGGQEHLAKQWELFILGSGPGFSADINI